MGYDKISIYNIASVPSTDDYLASAMHPKIFLTSDLKRDSLSELNRLGLQIFSATKKGRLNIPESISRVL
jgi:hypothetical protein